MFDTLREKYPLPPGWSAPELFEETVEIHGSRIELCGASTTSPRGEQVTGSAASADTRESCTVRGYFELLERASVVAASDSLAHDYEIRDRTGKPAGRAPRDEIFPASEDPARWLPSRSNGVAIHTAWDSACERALAELVERDCVLRSWYGESRPWPSGPLDLPIPDGLRRLAEWRAYEFAPGAVPIDEALRVAAVVGFPKDDGTPLTYGFACRIGMQEATLAAAVEAVQRFGFLFGEEIPQKPPAFSATPDFHQEFFLYPPSRGLLVSWLNGEIPEDEPTQDEVADRRPDRRPDRGQVGFPVFADLTPPHLRGRVFVVKAVCPSAEPLVFGAPPPHRSRVRAGRRVHPIA